VSSGDTTVFEGLTFASHPLGFTAARELFLPRLEAGLIEAAAGEGTLFSAARYHLETGGKRIRALLPPLLAHNLGANPSQLDEALELGLAFELIHNGTLVHDDLQDGDSQRRGKPTVWAHYGMQQAVNVGTAMLLLGLSRVLSTRVGGRIIADVNLAILRIVEGQALEFELQESTSPTVAQWERMSAGKTGALFGACLLGGTRVAQGGDRACDAAWQFGLELGIFFQIQDDLLDLVGNKGRDAVATDIAEGKISWPVAWATQNADPERAARLLSIVKTRRADTTPELVSEALAILHASGAIAACIDNVRTQAHALLGSPWAALMPGLVERVVEPVRHVLSDS